MPQTLSKPPDLDANLKPLDYDENLNHIDASAPQYEEIHDNAPPDLDSSGKPIQLEKGFFSNVEDKISNFAAAHPRIRRFGEELLTGTSPELQQQEPAGVSRVLGTPESEGSILPSWKSQPETFAGGFLKSLYKDFVEPLGSPSGILSGSIPLSPESAAARDIELGAKVPDNKLLTAGPRFHAGPEGTYDINTTPLRRGAELPYKAPESFDTSAGDTPKANERFNNWLFEKDKPEITTEDLLASKAAKEETPTATFKGMQDDGDGNKIPLYDIKGGPADGSTVSEDGLKKYGIETPFTPDNITDGQVPSFRQQVTPEDTTAEEAKTASTEIAKTDNPPKLVGLQNHGDGVMYAQFDRSNPVTADDIKSMFPDKNIQVTEFHAQTIPQDVQRFRIDALDDKGQPDHNLARDIEQSLGGQIEDPIKEMKSGPGLPPNNKQSTKGPYGAAIDSLLDKLDASKDLRSQQESLYHNERVKRVAQYEDARASNKPDWFKRASAALSGEYPKVEVPDEMKLSAEHTQQLFDAIKNSNVSGFENKRAMDSLKVLLDGERPLQRSEIKLLDSIFGNGLAEKLIEMHGGLGAVGIKIGKTANTMKAMMSSIDLSAPLRQGIGLIHRKEWWQNLPE